MNRHLSGNGWASNRRQTIAWINNDSLHRIGAISEDSCPDGMTSHSTLEFELWYNHDDVMKWKYLWHYWPITFPTQRPVTRSFGVIFDLCLNKRMSKQSWGWLFETPLCPLWHHRNVINEHDNKQTMCHNCDLSRLWFKLPCDTTASF